MEGPFKNFHEQDTDIAQCNAELEIKQMFKNLKLEVKTSNGITKKTIKKIRLCLGSNQILQRRRALNN